MADDDDSRQVEIELRGEVPQMIDRVPDVEVGARPSASLLTRAAIFDVPAGDSLVLQRIADRRQIAQR